MKKENLSVIIAPAKQTARIQQGEKVLKKYKFKTVIPFQIVKKEKETYDYSNWCVSERSGTRTVEVKVFCSKTIEELKIKILEYYLSKK